LRACVEKEFLGPRHVRADLFSLSTFVFKLERAPDEALEALLSPLNSYWTAIIAALCFLRSSA